MGTKQYDSATDLLTFSRASSATFLGSNGLLQTAANNVPRIEYDATGAVKGLLIEEARTNLVTYSNDFSSATWFKTRATVSANSTTSPSGATDADLLTTQSGGWAGLAFPSVSITSGTTYTGSIYAKANGYNWLQIGGSSPRFAATFANVNLSDGSLGNSNIDVIVTPAGNGWYRIAITAVATQTTSNAPFFVAVYNTDVASRLPDSPDDGTSGILVYGAQAETGAFPTSYIPTTGATATRARDLAEIPTSAFGYNNDKGSLVIDVLTPVADQFMGLAIFNTSSYFNSRSLWKSNYNINGDGDNFVFQTHDGLTTKFVFGQQTQAVYTKLGLSYGDSEKAVKDGGTVVSGDSRSPSPTRLLLGGRDNGYQSQCWIKSIQYYPRQLTDTQLQELTT